MMMVEIYGCMGAGLRGFEGVCHFPSVKRGTWAAGGVERVLAHLTCVVVKYGAVCVKRRLAEGSVCQLAWIDRKSVV